MKKIAGIILLSLFTTVNAFEFDIGVSGSKNGLDAFTFSIGDYYRVPQREVLVVQERLSRDDISIAYFLSRKAAKSIDYITRFRMRGDSWWDISISLGLNPQTLYVVQTQKRQGPPYGKAYGYEKNKMKSHLSDGEITELVNVKFLSSYHGVSTDEIIEQRRQGEKFINIDKKYHEQKAKRSDKKEKREWHGNGKKDKDSKKGEGRGRWKE